MPSLRVKARQDRAEEVAFLLGLDFEMAREYLRSYGNPSETLRPENYPIGRVDVERTNVDQVCSLIFAKVLAHGEQVVLLDDKRFCYCFGPKSRQGRLLKMQDTPERVGVYNAMANPAYIRADLIDTLDVIRKMRKRGERED